MEKVTHFLGKSEQGVFAQGLFSGAMEKTAGVPGPAWSTAAPIRNLIKTITPKDRRENCFVLVTALGAGEYYGSNINADFFPWAALSHVGTDYGYQTFLNAHAFAHHANKDPERAFGIPVVSALNHHMKKVELVIRLNREKAREEGALPIIQRIDSGEFPDVSMGCFTAGTLVTMSDGTRKPIEEVQVGDRVLSHFGWVKNVTAVHRRQYKGSLYSIKAEGHQTVRCTRQHPWLVAADPVKEKDDHANWQWKKLNPGQNVAQEWVHAECMNEDSYLLAPLFHVDESVSPYVVQPKRHEARLLGYYLAEGHLLRNKEGELSGIELTTHKDDPIHGEIEALCEAFGTKNKPVTFQRQNSSESLGIWIFDRELADFCRRNAGSYSTEKQLSKDVLSWKPEMQSELLGAYANGDGCGTEDGSLKLSTSSKHLAEQWLLILPRIGAIPSCSMLTHKAGSGHSVQDTYEWVVHIGKQYAQKFKSVCAKVRHVEIEKTKNSRKILGQYVVTPVREIVSMYAETEVFNLEVEGDESYLVEGLAVHNCKVPFDICSYCGHRSKTRDDYCEHMRPGPEMRGIWGPNKILENGQQICVINTLPRFFDISFVFIGADKIAKAMAKLAAKGNHLCIGEVCAIPRFKGEEAPVFYNAFGQEMSLSKTASSCDERTGPCGRRCAECTDRASCEMDKLASGFGVKEAEKKLSSIVKRIPSEPFTSRKLPEIEAKEKDFPKEVLDALAEYPLANSTGAATQAGVILKPHEFQRIVLIRMGEAPLADSLDAKRQVFRPSEEFDDSVDPAMPALREALEHLLPYLMERSAFSPALSMRLMKLANAPGDAKRTLPTRMPIGHSILDKVSAAYNGYRRNILMKLSQVRGAVESDSQLRSYFFGDELVSMFNKTASDSPMVDRDTVAYVMSAHLSNRNLLTTTQGNGALAVAVPWLREELSA